MDLEVLSTVAQLGLFFSTLLLAYVGYYQVNKVRAQSNADFIARLNREFYDENEMNHGIIQSVKEHEPILKKNGGSFTEYDIEGCIRYFEMIEQFIAEGVISFDLVDEMFGGYIKYCWDNEEIKGCVIEGRKERNDNRYFEHFEQLAARVTKYRTQ